MDNRLSTKYKTILIYAVFAVFCLVLFYITPYTRDDWAWGSSIGLDRLSVWFEDYNGRYGGNLVEIALANFRWLRTMVQTGVVVALVYLMVPATKNRIFLTLLSMTLVLLEPVAMMRQTLVYTAGFSNYVIPTMFIALFLRYFGNDLKDRSLPEKQNQRLAKAIVISMTAFVAALFMEHASLYLMFLACVIPAYSLYQNKKVYADQVGFFIGTLLGNVLMFSNGAYWNILSGEDGYRSLGNTTQATSPYMEKIGFILFAENFFYNIVLAITVIVILKNVTAPSQGGKYFKSWKFIGYIGAFTLLLLTIIISFVHTINTVTESQYGIQIGISYLVIVLYIVLMAVCLTTLIFTAQRSILKKRLTFILISMMVINVPLLIVNPVSPRCFFPTYMLMCIFIIQVLNRVRIKKRVSLGISGILICAMIGFLVIYSPLYFGETERVEYIKESIAKGENVIMVNRLPNEEFVWLITPYSGTKWEYRYKKFYGIPEDVTLINGVAQK